MYRGIFIGAGCKFEFDILLYMKNPKLIILYGFASSGKTTLAKRYWVCEAQLLEVGYTNATSRE